MFQYCSRADACYYIKVKEQVVFLCFSLFLGFNFNCACFEAIVNTLIVLLYKDNFTVVFTAVKKDLWLH